MRTSILAAILCLQTASYADVSLWEFVSLHVEAFGETKGVTATANSPRVDVTGTIDQPSATFTVDAADWTIPGATITQELRYRMSTVCELFDCTPGYDETFEVTLNIDPIDVHMIDSTVPITGRDYMNRLEADVPPPSSFTGTSTGSWLIRGGNDTASGTFSRTIQGHSLVGWDAITLEYDIKKALAVGGGEVQLLGTPTINGTALRVTAIPEPSAFMLIGLLTFVAAVWTIYNRFNAHYRGDHDANHTDLGGVELRCIEPEHCR